MEHRKNKQITQTAANGAEGSGAFVSDLHTNKNWALVLSCLAVLSGLSTYTAIGLGGVSLAQKTPLVTLLTVVDIVIIALLAFVVAQRIFWIFQEHKRGAIGARLHITIVSLFSMVTMAPAIVVSILAITFFKSGVSLWFSTPVRDTLNDAGTVAELYLQEHMRGIRVDAMFVANKIKPLMFEFDLFSEKDKLSFQKELDEIIEQQSLDEGLVLVIDKTSQRQTSVGTSLSFLLEMKLGDDLSSEEDTGLWMALNMVTNGDVLVREQQGVMQALTYVDSEMRETMAYVWVGKDIDRNILKYVTTARDSTEYYNKLLENHGQFQFVLITLFALSSLLLLLAAIWVGLFFANILIEPIRQLISAADSVSNGDLSIRIKNTYKKNELGHLVESFNRMTERLEHQNKDLIVSEKKSAWADIARKIAHEVKNPLTPIQLSAERIRRKYGGEIRGDTLTFEKCIDTIVRQVSHIENLINEFSAFARMPEAVIVPTDVGQLIRDAIFLQKQTYPNIDFFVEFPDGTVKSDCVEKGAKSREGEGAIVWPCDAQQMSQVFVNILQNAANAITENIRSLSDGGEAVEAPKDGKIMVVVQRKKDELCLIIEDNGPGFPKEKRERLFEPYYTTRKNGTGLGMAIVLRIVTEHSGTMELKDAQKLCGAMVEIKLPLRHL